MFPLDESDIKNLYKRFSHCKKTFEGKITPASHELLASKLKVAARACDICWLRFETLCYVAMSTKIKTIDENILRKRKLMAELDEVGIVLNKHKLSEETHEVKISTSQLVGRMVVDRLQVIDAVNMAERRASDAFELVLAYCVARSYFSLLDVFSADSSAKVTSVVFSLSATIGGLLPGIGNVVAIILGGANTYTAFKNSDMNTEEATRTLDYIDNFSMAAFCWAVTATALIDVYERRANESNLERFAYEDLNTAVEKVKSMYGRNVA